MIVRFSKKFYALKAIRNTIGAYEKLADFSVKTNKDTITVKARNIDKNIKNILRNEFSNYVLSEMKKIKSRCF